MDQQSANSRDEGARLLQAGHIQEALVALQQAVTEDPTDATAHGFLGICHARRGDLNASILSLEEAARLQPDDAGAHYNLAVALTRAQRLPEARAELERTLALDPKHAKARAALEGLGGGTSPTAAAPAGAVPTSPSGLVSEQPPDQSPEGSVGMYYAPPASRQVEMQPPSTGRRVGRGVLWGAVYGQWWTLWTILSMFLWGGLSSGKSSALGFVIVGVLCVLVFGSFGTLTGLIIGLSNPTLSAGMGIGIGVGLAVCVLEMVFLKGSPVNLIFYFVTGRFVGIGVTTRVLQPVAR